MSTKEYTKSMQIAVINPCADVLFCNAAKIVVLLGLYAATAPFPLYSVVLA